MRLSDDGLHPAAVERKKADRTKVVAGLVVAAAGLATVFVFREVYVGFAVALIGTGIVPFDKLAGVWKR